MRIAVCGGRSFTDFDVFSHVLDAFKFDEIISGGAKGADSMAERYAIECGIELTVCLAEWDKFPGNSAAYERNKMMVDMADSVIAFWDGKSKGTRMTMQLCWKAGKPLSIIRTDMFGECDG